MPGALSELCSCIFPRRTPLQSHHFEPSCDSTCAPQKELDTAMPALNAALDALKNLKKAKHQGLFLRPGSLVWRCTSKPCPGRHRRGEEHEDSARGCDHRVEGRCTVRLMPVSSLLAYAKVHSASHILVSFLATSQWSACKLHSRFARPCAGVSTSSPRRRPAYVRLHSVEFHHAGLAHKALRS